MDIPWIRLAETTLYLLVLINPISKILVLSLLAKELPPASMRGMILESTAFAWAILLALGAGGRLILGDVFHIQMHSLRVAAGIVLFFSGYNALSRGFFFEVGKDQKPVDISMVPLAAPMIAGPATITASITLNAEAGLLQASVCVTAAIFLNLLFMLTYRPVSEWLNRLHLMGALIRITGLIIAAISVEMVLTGLGEWWRLGPGAGGTR